MDVRAKPIPFSESQELWADLQDYIRELSVYDAIESENGVYHYKWFDAYWQSPSRWPFWAEQGKERAGFALVRREENGTMDMAEFYVRPSHRRTGTGLAFARILLEMFPGPWNISEYRANTGAVAFWREVASGYYYSEEEYVGDSGKQRLLQRVLVRPQGAKSQHAGSTKRGDR
jgi:predicted acetyltransferase